MMRAPLLVLTLVVHAFAYSCKWNGFDLSKLENDVQDYRQSMGLGGQAYYLNACRSVVTAACKTANCAACQTWSGGQACLGVTTSSTFTTNGNSLSLAFGGGDDGRSMLINFSCDKTAGTGTPVFNTETASKQYVFDWSSQYACAGAPTPSPSPPSGSPGSKQAGGISGGTIFLIVILCSTVVYLGAGVAWNYRRQETGVRLIPQVEFWTSIPGLVKDGALFIVAKIRGGGGGSYQSV
eukprot:TRINITY_DN27539_c0_g1_i1.p1 TRINITY_DN27539_c0_g1~~TRINITY_DN27539_c0_g1_i1.p1  ORF type:complete len:238 (-),score=26.74 TRINITY_DN27539_c0_g1_i1:219-932(-)